MKRRLEILAVLVLLAALSIGAARWCFAHGYTLSYGDAEAHLNIARRVLDSRTPGFEQLGTVWLPLPHLLMLPFVERDSLWQSGIGGVIPAAACFVLAGAFLYAAARRIYAPPAAAVAAVLVFALNPNMLYLQAAPMTEPVFAAALAAMVWALAWFRDSGSLGALAAAAAASNAASLTRYEGWFLIPFAALFVLFSAKQKWHAALFLALASLAPLAWLAHNQYYYSNALEFVNGPYSAAAIYRRQLAQGMERYPGDGDWRAAIAYYFAAMKLTIGVPVLLAGAAGAAAAAAIHRRALGPVILLALSPVFYIWSIHSSGTPVFVPDLRPYAWYNTRYGLAALPCAALAAGGLVALAARFSGGRQIWPGLAALAVAALPAAGALANPRAACWTESEVNSAARRDWTRQAADFLAGNYRRGSGVIYPFGDLAGVLREARIPLREGLHEGNRPYWDAAVIRPELLLHEEWALAFSGDPVSTAILRAQRYGPHYLLRKQIIVKGAPVVEIYQRQGIALPQ